LVLCLIGSNVFSEKFKMCWFYVLRWFIFKREILKNMFSRGRFELLDFEIDKKRRSIVYLTRKRFAANVAVGGSGVWSGVPIVPAR
jgi:hypothetical protein